ncbi:MAG: polymerase subunit sigma-24 [Mucilaginibacter sp.]|nr:polymerase subunit sigma-24 [Mucilaginibacter sp.]
MNFMLNSFKIKNKVATIQLRNDEELTQLLRNSNELAFTEIYNRYWDKLYYLAHKLLKDPTAAEEIVQDVFLILWKKREKLNIQSLTHYLAAMTRYAVYRYVAKEKNNKQHLNIVSLLNINAVEEIDIDNKLLLEIVTDLSNKLPEKCRLVFQCNKLKDQSLADVAKQLNISQKTAEGHLTKALRTIRTTMGNAMSFFLF